MDDDVDAEGGQLFPNKKGTDVGRTMLVGGGGMGKMMSAKIIAQLPLGAVCVFL
jgi:hypothetical protein